MSISAGNGHSLAIGSTATAPTPTPTPVGRSAAGGTARFAEPATLVDPAPAVSVLIWPAAVFLLVACVFLAIALRRRAH